MSTPTRVGSANGCVLLIVDVGAGDGTKLAGLHPRFDIIGVDYGANVERSAARYPFGAWRHHDLDAGEPLPVSDSRLRESVVVCSDAIEHLRAPHAPGEAAASLHHASALLISTPERELWHGVRSEGPPRNRHHVREWSIREFGHLLAAAGFDHLSIGLTRSNDRTEEPFTIERVRHGNPRCLVPLLISRPVPPARHALKARLVRAAGILRYG